MDTERWQILLKAIDRGSLRATAEEMGFTVSGISRSVATLEKELGFALLHRAKSGVQPTEECRQLLPVSWHALPHWSQRWHFSLSDKKAYLLWSYLHPDR